MLLNVEANELGLPFFHGVIVWFSVCKEVFQKCS